MAMPAPIVPAPITAARSSGRIGVSAARLGPFAPRARRRTHGAAPSTPASASARGSARARARGLPRTDRRRRFDRVHARQRRRQAPDAFASCRAAHSQSAAWLRGIQCVSRVRVAAASRPRPRRRTPPRRRADRRPTTRSNRAVCACVARRHRLAGDDHLDRRLDADHARQALRAARAGQDAELDLGQAELARRRARRDSGSASASSSPPPRQVPCDRRDHRLGARLRPFDELAQRGLRVRVGVPNSRMSAPPEKTPPAPVITIARTEESLSRPLERGGDAGRTAWERPLTGGLEKEMTATARSTR